jgi:hypothetical protein
MQHFMSQVSTYRLHDTGHPDVRCLYLNEPKAFLYQAGVVAAAAAATQHSVVMKT